MGRFLLEGGGVLLLEGGGALLLEGSTGGAVDFVAPGYADDRMPQTTMIGTAGPTARVSDR